VIRNLLIANRGEIARRIIRTARRLGIATVAVHSDPDAGSLFVLEADSAVSLGGATPASSYLRGDAVVEAALRAGADAVHPGYGFLSENAAFARQVIDAGLVWVGPSPEAIDAMGSKLAARELMIEHGVPVLPGENLTGRADTDLVGLAESVGWPVLIKASAGGGGRGMRLVRHASDLAAEVAAARREAESAFGDPTVFMEHYVEDPRHIEIQIFGDHHGNLVHLFERECSIQRRHQKIVEEAPSPVMTEQLRAAMGEAAVTAGRAIGYTGAGTVEFVVSPTGQFFFLEVNTRLQVEHPVTEEVTGLDLVALQLAVAEGDPLPTGAREARLAGHSIEVRIYAEDPAAGYLPSIGTLERFELAGGDGIRIETGVATGDVVSPNYDPMLAKVVATAATRAAALRQLTAALRRSRIHGVTTNRELLVAILEDEEFAAGRFDTHFLERKPPTDLVPPPPAAVVDLSAVAAAMAEQAGARRADRVWGSAPTGWRNNAGDLHERQYRLGERVIRVGYRLGRDRRITVDGDDIGATVAACEPDFVDLQVDSVRRRFLVETGPEQVWVDSALGAISFIRELRFPEPEIELLTGSLTAPMPGTVVKVEVSEGQTVHAGQVLLRLEAMKMEHPVVSPMDGTVAALLVTPGQNVDAGAVLAVIDGAEDETGNDAEEAE
jgi:acetyl/propionyl-CoA carboxylase alpha subunit